MSALLGIDFGGTAVKFGLVTRTGDVLARTAVPFDPVRRHLEFFTWPALHRNVQVLLAQPGNDAGVIGAAAMAASRLGSP